MNAILFQSSHGSNADISSVDASKIAIYHSFPTADASYITMYENDDCTGASYSTPNVLDDKFYEYYGDKGLDMALISD